MSGILVGVGLGLFLAPRRGQELREQAGQRAQELWRRREDVLAQRQEQAAQAAQRAGGALLGSIQRGMTALRGQLAEAIAAGREAAQQAAQEARSRYEAMAHRDHPKK
ncbi:MAG TPA: YtxH domain-containing protein [Dehalococcoidia bacterium]|nr:YtxH domain-containing protein [Dehalococcoidia bacterium]